MINIDFSFVKDFDKDNGYFLTQLTIMINKQLPLENNFLN